MRKFESCGALHPGDPEIKCLSNKGHSDDHGVDVWPQGFQVGAPTEISWSDIVATPSTSDTKADQ